MSVSLPVVIVVGPESVESPVVAVLPVWLVPAVLPPSVGSASVALPLPLARSRRFRCRQRERLPRRHTAVWFEARGPPLSA